MIRPVSNRNWIASSIFLGLLLFYSVIAVRVGLPVSSSSITTAIRNVNPIEYSVVSINSQDLASLQREPRLVSKQDVKKDWFGREIISPPYYVEPIAPLPRSEFGDARYNPLNDKIEYDPYSLPGIAYFTGLVRNITGPNDVQTAFNAAQASDIISINSPISVASGSLVIPTRGDSGHVLIIDSSVYSSLPAIGTRVQTSAFATANTVTVTGFNPWNTFSTVGGSSGWYFHGVHIKNGYASGSQGAIDNVGLFQGNDTPSRVAFVHSWLENPWTLGGNKFSRRALPLGSMEHFFLLDSHITGFVGNGTESQTMNTSAGRGKYKIYNTALEACSETIMWGATAFTVLTPKQSDIYQGRLYMYRRPEWMIPSTQFHYTNHKNFYESKDSQFTVFEESYCTGFSGGGQQQCINLKPTPQSAANVPFVACTNITVRLCHFNDYAAPIAIGGSSHVTYKGTGSTVEVDRCLWTNPRYVNGGGGADRNIFASLTLPNVMTSVIIHNCTFPVSYALVVFGGSTQVALPDFRFYNNVNYVGVNYGSPDQSGSIPDGAGALDYTCGPGNWTFTNNWQELKPTQAATYVWPTGLHAFNSAKQSILFADETNGNYTLTDPAVKNTGTDGKDPGVDFPRVQAAVAGVITG